MKLYALPILLVVLVGLSGNIVSFAQRAPSEATNIRISTDEKTKRLVIQYDLLSVQAGDSLYVEIETASGRRFRPATVSGNVGKTLSPGRNKTVYWDIVRDNVQLDEEVEVIIRLVRPVLGSRPATVAKAPKPVAAPVMASPKKSALPIVGWVATAGLAAYAFTLSSSLNKDVDAYNLNTVAPTLAEWNTAETQRKSIDSRQGTFTIVAGAAAVLAVANIAWLIVRKSKPRRTAWQVQPGVDIPGASTSMKFTLGGQAIRLGFVHAF